MTAEFAFLPGHVLTMLIPAVLYMGLVIVIALTAVFTSKPVRRKAALEVLQLLLPGRRHHAVGSRPHLRVGRRRDLLDRPRAPEP